MAVSRPPPNPHVEPAVGNFWTSRTLAVWIAFLLIGGFLLASEHRAHILGAALWLLILACPLLHMFGHRRHGGHGGHGQHQDQSGTTRRDATGTRRGSKGEKS
ncbi:MAG: DUF2933 domain-containing protein [Hyphomicrobiaceae bacterium]